MKTRFFSLGALFFAVFFVSLSPVLSGQEGWQLGFFASEHTSWLYNVWDFDPAHHNVHIESSRLDKPDGWAGGAYVVYGVNNWLSLRVDPNYSWQRHKYRVCKPNPLGGCRIDQYDAVVNVKLSYISLPLQVQLAYTGLNNSRFYVKGGLEFSFLPWYKLYRLEKSYNALTGFNYNIVEVEIKNTRKIVYYASAISGDTINGETSIDYLFKRVIWNVVGGIGWSYELGNGRGALNFGLRGSYSLVDVENKDAKTRDEYGGTAWLGALYPYGVVSGIDLSQRPATHLIRVGLEVGMVFYLY